MVAAGIKQVEAVVHDDDGNIFDDDVSLESRVIL